MRPGRAAVAALGTVAVLAALPGLAGCAHGPRDPAGSRRPAATRPAGPGGRGGGPAAALRAGLSRTGGSGPVYYLALGDSLARGIQPGAAGRDVPTRRGYADVLAARLRGGLPRLRLVKLGCPGETTTTMIRGGICRYPAGSQLAQAAAFLRAHRGRAALITIDIGANDVNSCVLGRPVTSILSCLLGRISQTAGNLGTILGTLRSASGGRVPITGMTYYVPELALWRNGRSGRRIAVAVDDFVAGANRILAARYRRYGARVADVFGAFRSTDFGGALARANSLGEQGRAEPPNVAAICALTWMCAPPPRGPNEHADNAGYRLIAAAFWRALTGRTG